MFGTLPHKPATIPSVEGLSDDEAIAVLIESLEKIDDRDSPTIFGGGSAKTVNDVITQLREKTPEGMEFLGLARRALVRMKELEEKRREAPSTSLTRLKSRIGNALRGVGIIK